VFLAESNIHGDARLCRAGRGYGNLPDVPDHRAYKELAGPIHIIVNNQVGFTRAAGAPLYRVLSERGEDDSGADLPCEWAMILRAVLFRHPVGSARLSLRYGMW